MKVSNCFLLDLDVYHFLIKFDKKTSLVHELKTGLDKPQY